MTEAVTVRPAVDQRIVNALPSKLLRPAGGKKDRPRSWLGSIITLLSGLVQEEDV
jgi:hypothetical protein